MLLCITGISEADAQLLFVLQSPLDHSPALSPSCKAGEAESAGQPLGACREGQVPFRACMYWESCNTVTKQKIPLSPDQIRRREQEKVH